MEITTDIVYVGVNDHDIDLFEGQYVVPRGMAYNSYLVKDAKTAVMDTVDARFGDEWLKNVAAANGGKAPDYLVIHHMEPDHSANIAKALAAWPETTVVASAPFMPSGWLWVTSVTARDIAFTSSSVRPAQPHALTRIAAPFPQLL